MAPWLNMSHDLSKHDGWLYFWVCSCFFVVHGIAVVAFAQGVVPMAGPEADAGAMVWIVWLLVDAPLSFVVFDIAETASTNAGAITIVAIGGGVQWIIWGIVLTRIMIWLRDRSI